MFMLFDDRLTAIEVKTGLLMLRDPVDVQYYVDTFEYFRSHALRGETARDFILSVAEDHHRDVGD